MQLFTRSVTLAGPIPDVMTYATDMRSYASDKLGVDIALWSAMFGAPRGSMTYALRVDGVAGVAAIDSTLMADDGYLTKAEAGRQYLVGAREDALMNILHGELGDTSPPVGSVATVTTAVIGGSYADAIGWGVEMSQLAQSITGVPVMFGMNEFGAFGQLGWIGVTADAAGADAANSALAGNDDYIKALESANSLFVPGSGHRTLATRIA